jgi:hypothetical protein
MNAHRILWPKPCPWTVAYDERMRATYWALQLLLHNFPFRCTQRTLARASVDHDLLHLSLALLGHGRPATAHAKLQFQFQSSFRAWRAPCQLKTRAWKPEGRWKRSRAAFMTMAQSDKRRVPRSKAFCLEPCNLLTRQMQFNRRKYVFQDLFSKKMQFSPRKFDGHSCSVANMWVAFVETEVVLISL